MGFGRLEAQIRVPTGGWTGTIDDSGGGGAAAWSVAAGTYYIDELVAALHAALNTAATTDTIYVTIAHGELGTGKVTISGTGTFAIVWIHPDLRDLLGYTTNLSGSSSYVAPNHARSIWLGDCAYRAPNEIYPWGGWPEADFRTVESAAGQVWAYVGQKKETTWLEWEAVRRARASKANESVVNESFQRFVEDGVWGFAAWGTPGGPLRFFPDANAGGWVEYFATELGKLEPTQFADGWAGGPWKVRLPRLVVKATGTVTVDGPSSVYVPESARDFVILGLPITDFLWLCQDGSGSLVNVIGASASMSPNLAPLYQQAVSGWNRRFAGTVDGTPEQRFATFAASLDLAVGESYAVVAYASMSSANSGRVLQAQGFNNSIVLQTNNTLLTIHNGQTGTLAGNYDNAGLVHPLVWYRDCAANVSGAKTDLAQTTATHNASAQVGQPRGFGGAGGGDPVPTTRFCWYAVYKGINAEGDFKAYLQRLRWPLSY